jgi:hypothetical protein
MLSLNAPPGPPVAGPLERALASCFLVRDGEAYLRRNVLALQDALAASVDQLRFFYVENDSSDSTRQILDDLASRMPRRFKGSSSTS